VIEVDDPATAVIMAVVFGVVGKILIRAVDLMTVGFVVRDFVNRIG